MSALMEVRDLTVGFADARGIFLPADHVNLAIEANQTVGLLGESGCGKSVTLRSLMRMVPYPGEIVGGSLMWKGRDLCALDRPALTAIRGREISMIFQDPAACLNPVFTVGNQMTETLRVKAGLGRAVARERAIELLSHVGIASARERLSLYPHELSGGMRQRVMIAMAIATRPGLLLADEPTTALDVTIQDQILTLLAELKDETGMAMILVSHDVGVVAQNCDVIAVMYAGRIMESGPASAVVQRPRHPYTKALLAAVPGLEAKRGRGPLNAIPGQPPNLAELPPGCPFQPRCAYRTEACAGIPVILDAALPAHGSACPVVN